jgi:hypothetical protein
MANSFFDIFNPLIREHMRKLDPMKLRVLLAYLVHADDAMTCYPSIGKLAQITGRDRRAIFRATEWLTSNGYLCTIQAGGGRFTTKRRVTLPPVVTTTTGYEHHGVVVTTTTAPVATDTTAAVATTTTLTTKGTSKRTAKKTDQGAAVAALPLPFDSDAFKAAWLMFQDHRRELRKPMKITGAELILKDLGAMTESDAIAAIQRSVKFGYQGIFADKRTTTTKPSKRAGEFHEDITL